MTAENTEQPEAVKPGLMPVRRVAHIPPDGQTPGVHPPDDPRGVPMPPTEAPQALVGVAGRVSTDEEAFALFNVSCTWCKQTLYAGMEPPERSAEKLQDEHDGECPGKDTAAES